MGPLWILACSGSTPSLGTDIDAPDDTSPASQDCQGDPDLAVTEVTTQSLRRAHEVEISTQLTAPAPVAVACTLASDPEEVHLVEATDPATSHQLRLSGLLANSDYDCVAAPSCQGSGEGAAPFTLSTPRLAPDLPVLEVLLDEPAASLDYVLMNQSRDCNWSRQHLMVYDRAGRVRWHDEADARSGPSLEFRYHGDDTFAWGGGWTPNAFGRPRLIDLYDGEIYDSADDLPDTETSAFHHDGKWLPDGSLLTLEETPVKTPGAQFQGFSIRRIVQGQGVDFHYDSQRAVDEGHLPEGDGDAWHANWVDVDTVDGEQVAYVSLCFLGSTVAIDVPSGRWRWSFGPGGDFTLVDSEGAALPDQEFPQCQHGLAKQGDRLLVYDNGAWGRGHSRVTEYQLDETTMTATLLWTWTEPDWFETTLGSVDWLPDGHVLVGMGHAECFSSNRGDHTTVVEIDPTSQQKLWEGRYAEIDHMAYRADFATGCELFHDTATCPDLQQRLEQLRPVFGAP
ncbi:MAG: aryl-sulfate sulfotransferase [Myxococcales bacterium]|nr:aryl-sulfate sulfotransferase [Myxococcales bacterium]